MRPHRWIDIGIGIGLLLLGLGCPPEPVTHPCNQDDDCPIDQLCLRGLCIAAEVGGLDQPCASSGTCQPGLTCVDDVCLMDAPDGGGSDAAGDGGDDATVEPCLGVECADNEVCLPQPDGSPLCVCGTEVCVGTTTCLQDAAGSGSRRCCSGGEDNCGGSCVTPGTVEACAGCGDICAWGESCEAGVCLCAGGARCDPLFQDCCNGTCFAVESDVLHCGAIGTGQGCNNACLEGKPCTGGVCLCRTSDDCGPGQSCCDLNYCADVDSDVANCGTCHRECGEGEICTGGTCVCPAAGCDDGDACTEDICSTGNRCIYRTLDGDDDGYCAPGCDDASTGFPGDCQNGDCDDGDPARHPGHLELCDGLDNDCDGPTVDGSGESWYGEPCDGTDTDACDEGVLDCQGGRQVCTDTTGDNLEICDGTDNDCRPSTPDGLHDDACGRDPGRCCGTPAACRTCCASDQCGFGETCDTGSDYMCHCGSGAACNAVQDCCSGSCYNVLEDEAHCGPVDTGVGCIHACTGLNLCTDGRCECSGPDDCAGVTPACCGGTPNFCVDTDSDPAYCGGCGNACRLGETCVGGICRCSPGECNDGYFCTSDICCTYSGCGDDLNRCIYPTRDEDGDGYCHEACTGVEDGCVDGDCDDNNPDIHPGAQEVCNGVNDDCDDTTQDNDALCPGAFCCGTPRSCHECCQGSDCGTGVWSCTESRTCMCSTEVCAGGFCRTSEECCGQDDCGDGLADWTCNPSTHLCSCAGLNCGTSCYGGANRCCDDNSCADPAAPHCDPEHLCGCPADYGLLCPAPDYCVEHAECCSGAQCGAGGAWACTAHQCSCMAPNLLCPDQFCRTAGQCCDATDCGTGAWICAGHLCSCSGAQVCISSGASYCLAPGEDCCLDTDCLAGQTCVGHLCVGDPLKCGNNEDDPDEACDDGNTMDGDQCNADCSLACPDGITYNLNCYVADDPDNGTSWPTAQLNCESRGMHLLTLKNAAEMTFVADTLLAGSAATEVWLGLTDLAVEGTWSWRDGDLSGWTAWVSGQPDDAISGQDCAVASTAAGHGWRDEACDRTVPVAICEIEPGVTAAICSNGTVEPGEACDDSNRSDGDQCSQSCTVECLCSAQYCLQTRTFADHCYQFSYTSTKSWTDALDSCRTDGVELTAIGSQAEHDFLDGWNGSLMTWIGLNDVHTPDTFTWSNGESLVYENWHTDQPDNAGGVESCVEIRGNNGLWNDALCSLTKSFVCEN